MAQSNEEIKVGVVVAIGVGLFLVALIFVGGVHIFGKRRVAYTTYFKFAGGLEPGSVVRFGGLRVGVIKTAGLDPGDTTRVRMTVEVDPNTPVRTNSKARISSLGFLGENYLEISAGTRDAPRLPAGSEIPSVEIVQISDVFNNVNNITLNATKLVNDLDDRVLTLSDNANLLIHNLNDVVSPENKGHFSSVLANSDEMIKESRPHLQNTITNLETASGKVPPTIDNVNGTIGRADKLTDHLDEVIEDNRQQLHDALVRLQGSLADAQKMVNHLDDTVGSNRENLDETLENIRVSSENLKELTDTLKQRPFSLIRIKAEKDRVPPTGK
jgi:phospholipid/cholesterol/gamma-HCH transport system substrate-binding protein